MNNAFVKPDKLFHDLILPANMVRPWEKDWKALKEHVKMLLHTFEHSGSRHDAHRAAGQHPEADV
jgi:hypothetical protein